MTISKKKQGFIKMRLKSIGNGIAFTANIIPQIIPFIKNKKSDFVSWSKFAQKKLNNPAKANFDLGKHFYNISQYGEAGFRFYLAILMNNQLKEAYLYLAKCQIIKQKWHKAKITLEKISKENKDYDHAQYFLSIIDDKKKELLPDNKVNLEYFNIFAEIFDQYYIANYNYKANEIITKKYVDSLPKTDAKIFEVGCGCGYLGQSLKQKLPKLKITAIDFSDKMIDQARNIFFTPTYENNEIIHLNDKEESFEQQKNVYDTLIKKDFLEYDIKDKYDAVLSRGLFNYIDDIEKSFEKISKILTKKGFFIFYLTEEFNKEDKKYVKENITYPFYLNKRFHKAKTINELAKKHSFKKVEEEKFDLEDKSKATLFIFEKE